MEFYHVLNRGVDKRDIFLDDRDYYRFVHDLYEFNDSNPVLNNSQLFGRREVGLRYFERRPRDLLLKIPSFSLMRNHYHLLLQISEAENMTKFMRKLNTGFTNYFNERNSREGALFQGKFKRILIENERQFAHIVVYIQLNPLDYYLPEWRRRALSRREIIKCLDFLEKYRWSSHLDYVGKNNFPSVTSRDYFLDFFGSSKGYTAALENWLKAPKFSLIKDAIMEDVQGKSDFL